MPRRRKQADATSHAADRGVPPELMLGRCIEVWGDADAREGMDAAISAMRNYSRAAAAWRAEMHATGQQTAPLDRPATPWSLHFCDAQYGPDRADQRLRVAGVTRDDLPRLRQAAQVWLAKRTGPS